MLSKIIKTAEFSTKVFRDVDGAETSCYMTVQARDHNCTREADFGSGSFEEMCATLTEMVKAYAGSYHPITVVAELSVDQIKFHFTLKNREHASIFIGRKAQHIQLLFNWLRAQQIYPHNRKIQVLLTKEGETGDEQVQSFWDRNDGFWDRKSGKRK